MAVPNSDRTDGLGFGVMAKFDDLGVERATSGGFRPTFGDEILDDFGVEKSDTTEGLGFGVMATSGDFVVAIATSDGFWFGLESGL